MNKSILVGSALALAVGLPSVVYLSKPSSAAPIQALKDATRLPLGAGTVIKKGMKLPSPSGNNNLVFGGNGDLGVADKSGNLYFWFLSQAIPNFGQVRIDRIEFRADGSLVGVNDKGAVVWTAPVTRRDPAATLTITDGGTLQLATSNEILWASSDAVGPLIRVFTNPASMTTTTPDSGWYAAVELTDPKIKINYSAGVSPSAVNAVANIYTEMMKRLKPTRTAPNPKRKFDGFKVFLTNEEPWELVKKLPGVGNIHPDPPAGTIITKDTPTAQRGGEILLGAGGPHFLWICEQLICKKGIKTPERRGIVDDSYRTFDQVVHEMAHSIDSQLVDDPILNQFKGAGTPVESFAWRVQDWFGVPGRGKIPADQETLLNTVFTSRALFSPEGYRPIPAEASAPATRLPINPGTVMKKGVKLPSRSGNHTLVVGTDGNLVVVTKDNKYVWGFDQVIPNLGQVGLNQAEFRRDGSLGAYDGKGLTKWIAPNTTFDHQAQLDITDEGVLQIANTKEVLWASNGVVGEKLQPATGFPIRVGSVLSKGMKLPSRSGNHTLVVGTDGNLVVVTKDNKYVWGLDKVIPNFGRVRVDRVEFRSDGRFGAYDDKRAVLWQAPLKRLDPKAQLTVTDQGILQILSASGEVLWASTGG
ncbi:hypothetical protein [Armatimonas sp.]|uniref:hypothetical protein n=1 Tax=Armatimonas sp. TaxID=1872638 RepID=UPI00374D4CB6